MSFAGYNFFRDNSAITPNMITPNPYSKAIISNGIFEHLNILTGTQEITSTTIPSQWTGYTLFDCDFTSLNAGNVNWQVEQISKILIKRRISGTIEWITLAEVIVQSEEDLTFTHHDYYNADNVIYDYALVVVDLLGNEQAYNIGTINSVFNKTFITDGKVAYDLTKALSYDGYNRNQVTGTYQTMGRKYPLIVRNSTLNYASMSTSAYLIYSTQGINNFNQDIDRPNEVKFRNGFLDFLLNNKAKILKDYNGNIWLIGIVENSTEEYLQELGNGIAKVSFSWVELGNSNSETDMKNSNLIPVSPIYSQEN